METVTERQQQEEMAREYSKINYFFYTGIQ